MASSSSSPLTAAPFTPLLPILNAFNHRHHNQHRLAHWWPVFRSLRRTIRNLIDDLTPSTSLSSRPTRRETIPPRAIWLNKHFIPRAYVAFSQLAADNQHAPLGLLLLAILARIHTALSPLSIDTSIPKPQPKTNRANDLANQDKGVTIARQELPSATSTERINSSEQQQQGSKLDCETTKPPKSKKEASPSSPSISKDKKKKKKGKGDALSSLFSSLA
ncbi:hypothetical protein ACHAPE_007781 [Trichoderma viride]